MLRGSLTGYVDIAQVTLYVFWAFFAGLIFYLQRESHREGYPLVSAVPGKTGELSQSDVVPPSAPVKRFKLFHGGFTITPDTSPPRGPEGAIPAALFPGAPLDPTGDALIDGLGPASYAFRADEPDLTIEGNPRYVPLRSAPGYNIDTRLPNPIGMNVVGVDGVRAGTCIDVWFDIVENEVVFLEVALPEPFAKRVLVPQGFVRYRPRTNIASVRALSAERFAGIPQPRVEGRITRLEEDKILGYFGGGAFYGMPRRPGTALTSAPGAVL
nr:photosynthetic reaction center subunit H [uncultured Lichenicoccus sp.]